MYSVFFCSTIIAKYISELTSLYVLLQILSPQLQPVYLFIDILVTIIISTLKVHIQVFIPSIIYIHNMSFDRIMFVCKNYAGKRKFTVTKGSGSTVIKESTLREISDGCDMYLSCLQMFPLLSADVLLSLSCNGDIISKLWFLLDHSLSLNVAHVFQMITSKSSLQPPLYYVLVLAVQVTQYFLA